MSSEDPGDVVTTVGKVDAASCDVARPVTCCARLP